MDEFLSSCFISYHVGTKTVRSNLIGVLLSDSRINCDSMQIKFSRSVTSTFKMERRVKNVFAVVRYGSQIDVKLIKIKESKDRMLYFLGNCIW